MVRKERKPYGTGRIVEWEARPESKVIMVEDVINTGKSVLDAINHTENEGAEVKAVFCVVDRGENTKETFLKRGYDFFSIFKASELA